MNIPQLWICGALTAGMSASFAHEASPVTHSFEAGVPQPGPRLRLTFVDADTGKPLAARFSLEVDGQTFQPAWIDAGGIRFKSIHRTKRQEFTALYARGDGPVVVGLPRDARRVEIVAARGFEYLPGETSARVEGEVFSARVAMRRWSDLEAAGWIAVEEHLHYDRLDPAADAMWLTLLEADGLAAGHFMVAKGGMMPGIWAAQHAYGARGYIARGGRLIVPGEEYRDSAQGHVNLLGLGEVIEPISTGGMGTPAVAENFPPLHDVLVKAKTLGGLTGAAHGGTLGRMPTALADAVLGAFDFWEISNGFIYSTEAWYRLMNCGYFLPPAAGTDLPNHPFRDPWQPMLGSVRTYVQTGGRTDFASFKTAVAAGRVFVTGGPLIGIEVDGKGPGETIHLPAGGGSVLIRAGLRSPQALQGLELIHNGRPLPADVRRRKAGEIDEWTIEQRLTFTASGWIAAAGTGARIPSQGFDARAHTGVIRVLVDRKPVRVREDVAQLIGAITRQRDFYDKEARYRTEADRLHAVSLFDRALEQLRERLDPKR
ncbi:MAG: CehA/McbA family metallohydrolase [Opitutaceae bacterium]|nr:CehA/McbA family metallohydrolase [Opitutaceae bacterium]